MADLTWSVHEFAIDDAPDNVIVSENNFRYRVNARRC